MRGGRAKRGPLRTLVESEAGDAVVPNEPQATLRDRGCRRASGQRHLAEAPLELPTLFHYTSIDRLKWARVVRKEPGESIDLLFRHLHRVLKNEPGDSFGAGWRR